MISCKNHSMKIFLITFICKYGEHDDIDYVLIKIVIHHVFIYFFIAFVFSFLGVKALMKELNG